MTLTANNANAFASTFYFFAAPQCNAKKNKKSLQATAQDSADICIGLTRHSNGQTEARTDNTGLAKVAVQCFVGQFCGYINISASYESLC